ncbi:UNVERIFIED_CONTAM: protein NSP-INTERACTING kinase [Sesamum calycinum]|uniref:Protein NSP-INTERACTING kinase n=1 Tax=Sesamum calycinum TaxID=2727403 RepID=A0AAW2RA43_9LAMI
MPHTTSSKNIIGKGGFGNVYKGYLRDGTVVAVKRLKDGSNVGGEIQFQTEVEMISLAVHRNLLRLYGFCITQLKASHLSLYGQWKCCFTSQSQTTLDWGTRKRIALGAARGCYTCTSNVIRRSFPGCKGNILLDEYYEAVVGDFGLAKLLDHRDSMLQQLGLLNLAKLPTRRSYARLELWIQGEENSSRKKLDMLVDKDLRNNYDRIELEEMVQVALLSHQYLPNHRPKMSEVVRMLEGDGLAEKWEASQRAGYSMSGQ